MRLNISNVGIGKGRSLGQSVREFRVPGSQKKGSYRLVSTLQDPKERRAAQLQDLNKLRVPIASKKDVSLVKCEAM
jgi:hypothetical protein